jgi:hypothetical protein
MIDDELNDLLERDVDAAKGVVDVIPAHLGCEGGRL